MRTSRIIREQQMAAILSNRMAAILCSTRNLPLYRKTPFSDIYHRQGTKGDELYNLLLKRNYFSATLAKRLVALVIKTEGKNKPLCPRGVTRWA